MPKQTNLLGKDAPAEATVDRLTRRLADLGCDIVESGEENPLPGVWSVHIRDRRCPILATNGKGTSRVAAMASALGEFCERLATNFFFTDYYLGAELAAAPIVHDPGERWFSPTTVSVPEEILGAELISFYEDEQPLELGHLVDTNSGNFARGVCARPFLGLHDGQQQFFPVALLNNLYVSNGMAAGNSVAEARSQALGEILERQVKARVIGEGISLPLVPPDRIAACSEAAPAIAALEKHGLPVSVRDASLGGAFPVININLFHPESGTCLAAFGASPRFEVALTRTLTELLQGRALERLGPFTTPSTDRDEVADPQNMEVHFINSSGVVGWDFLKDKPQYEFADWDFTGPTTAEFDHLYQLLHRAGHKVYVADYDHLGVYACRIVVPGFSEIYPVGDLVDENQNEGAQFRREILNLPRLTGPACLDLRERLIQAGFTDHRPVTNLIGILPEPGTGWENLRIGELKTMLSLAGGDRMAALQSTKWCLLFDELPNASRRLYLCLEALLELSFDPYLKAADCQGNLVQLFGEETLNLAHGLIAGKERFPGLTAPGENLTGLTGHQEMLAIYKALIPTIG